MKYPLTELGIEVRHELDLRGESLSELADSVDCDYGFVWSVLHGRSKSRRMEGLIREHFGWEN